MCVPIYTQTHSELFVKDALDTETPYVEVIVITGSSQTLVPTYVCNLT